MPTETRVSDGEVVFLLFITEGLILFAALVASVSLPVLGAMIASAVFCYLLRKFPFLAEVYCPSVNWLRDQVSGNPASEDLAGCHVMT